MAQEILKEAMAMQETIKTHRRYLHEHAEVGFELPDTFAYVMDTLQRTGITPQKVGRCGIVASIGEGDTVAMLRADMDALPVREESDLPFACRTGNAHVCGHDMHTAMLLGAAALLKRHESTLKGSVRLMFQPAEESLAGASDMINAGLLEPSCPSAAMMIHVMNTEGLKPGTVIVPPAGVSAPAADFFEIGLQGKGCHGAMPQNGIDPINVGAHLVLALQAISTRELGMNDAHALTVSAFQAGDAANVMPDQAVLRGSVRSFDLDIQQFLKKRIEEITQLTAQTFRAEARLRWLGGCPTLVNHPELTKLACEAFPIAIGSERVLSAAKLGGGDARSVGSEDFSYISQQIPSLMLAMAAGGISNVPLHHPKIIFNEEALSYGAAVYAAFALARMNVCR
ncbi:MAG: amidohydrolase [Clostridiales bacterium]|nr:amidohydrolase [Clostridiales bacterium]